MEEKKSTFKVLFYLKKNAPKKDGTVPIMIRTTIDGVEKTRSAKVSVNPDRWDKARMRVTGRDAYATKINNALDLWERNIGAKYDTLFHYEGYVTAEKVDNAVMGTDAKKMTLLTFFKQHNDEFKLKVGKTRAENTHRMYCDVYNHVESLFSIIYPRFSQPFRFSLYFCPRIATLDTSNMNKFVFQCSLSTDQVNLLKEFSDKIHINGDAVVQFEERGQFYFLCSKDSNLQQHYTNDNGWLITYSYPFNDELIIGQGLHESTTYAGYLHTFEDKDKVRMWNDILDFAFRSDFHRVFFPMENYFKGCLKLDNSLCFYLYDYVPVSRNLKASTDLKKTTNLLFRMKEGHVVSLTAKLFSLAMSRIYTITDKKGNSILRNYILLSKQVLYTILGTIKYIVAS